MGTAPPFPWHQRVKGEYYHRYFTYKISLRSTYLNKLSDKFMQKMSLTKTRSLTFAWKITYV